MNPYPALSPTSKTKETSIQLMIVIPPRVLQPTATCVAAASAGKGMRYLISFRISIRYGFVWCERVQSLEWRLPCFPFFVGQMSQIEGDVQPSTSWRGSVNKLFYQKPCATLALVEAHAKAWYLYLQRQETISCVKLEIARRWALIDKSNLQFTSPR